MNPNMMHLTSIRTLLKRGGFSRGTCPRLWLLRCWGWHPWTIRSHSHCASGDRYIPDTATTLGGTSWRSRARHSSGVHWQMDSASGLALPTEIRARSNGVRIPNPFPFMRSPARYRPFWGAGEQALSDATRPAITGRIARHAERGCSRWTQKRVLPPKQTPTTTSSSHAPAQLGRSSERSYARSAPQYLPRRWRSRRGSSSSHQPVSARAASGGNRQPVGVGQHEHPDRSAGASSKGVRYSQGRR